jgi:nucleoside-diphosphate-sugar epimerase
VDVAVTGSHGFIGSALVLALTRAGQPNRSVSRLDS